MAQLKARFRLKLNVSYSLRDKDGKIKPLFQENRLGKALLLFFRKHISSPIGEDGQVKAGLLNSLSAYGLRLGGITGSWTQTKLVSNLITTAGKAYVAGVLNGSSAAAAADYVANGTGTTAADVANTTLETELAASGLTRAQGTASRVTTDTTNDTARVTKAFTVSGTVAITECGLLNASSGGTLLARQVFSAINLVSGDTWTPTWNIDID